MAQRRLARFLVFIAVVAGGFLVLRATPVSRYLAGEELAEALELLRQLPGAPMVFVLAATLLTTFGLPGTVIIIAGGAVFGFLLGWLLSLVSLMAGAIISYVLARSLARDLVVHVLGRRLAPVERLIDRHGFWTVARLRLVPIPFAVINYGLSLAGIGPATYVAASLLGLAPATFVWSYISADFSAALVAAGKFELSVPLLQKAGLALLLLLLLSFLPTAFKVWRQRGQERRH